MSPNKKADLQRKLTLAPVPKPPAGLAERIKSEIPADLRFDTERERRRFSQSMSFNIRIAASILLLVSSAYLCIRLLSIDHETRSAMRQAQAPSTTVSFDSNAPAPAVAVAPPSAAKTLTVPIEPAKAQPRPAPVLVAENREQYAATVAENARDEEQNLQVSRYSKKKEDVAVVSVPKPMDEMRQRSAAETEAAPSRELAGGRLADTAKVATVVPSPAAAASAPAPAPPPVAPAPPPVAQAPASAAKQYDMAGVDFVQEAKAADLDLRRPSTLFGISVDHEAFDRVKSQLEAGERPAASSVNVEALANYFAGPAPHSSREVKLEVEGSPAPLPNASDRLILRFTIDTATADVPVGASLPPIATNASLMIEFDSKSVASFRRLGGSSTFHTEKSLLKNTSVTAVYEIELKPHAWPQERVVTVRVKYRSAVDAKEHEIAHMLKRRDMAPTWAAASRRHRLASLAAMWGESLKESASDDEIARRAEELSRQEPEDVRARELAAAVTASARLRGTSGTGSGR